MTEPTPAPTPNRAVYGFAWFLFFNTLFVLYVGWALLPDFILQDYFHFTYLPDKYFALFLPILVLCALTVFAFLIYPPWNMSMQDDVNDVHTLRDKHVIVRCQHINQSTGRRCEHKVDSIPADASNNFNRWTYETYCIEHKCPSTENTASEMNNENCNELCDCLDKNKCWLNKHPNHLDVLHRRATVPNACDLDVSDVSKQLFLDK